MPEPLSNEHGTNYSIGLDLPDGLINRETFPLPAELSARLKAVSVTLHDGRGFEIVRGLSPHKYSDKENIVLFAGIASHVADRRSRQLRKAIHPLPISLQLLTRDADHVYDSSNTKRPGKITPPFLPVKMVRLPMNFENHLRTEVNRASIPMSMAATFSLCTLVTRVTKGEINTSRAHGKCITILRKNALNSSRSWPKIGHGKRSTGKLCSLAMPSSDPDKKALLKEDSLSSRMTGNSKLAMKPILYSVDDKVQVSYTTAHLMGSQYGERPASFPSVSPAQLLAHNTVQALAEKFSFKLQHQDGDILLMNNLSIFHARDAYTDAKEAPGPKRHLMRMYLRDTDRAWPKPDAYRQILDNQFDYMPEEQKYATLQEDMELGEFLDNVDLTKKAPKREHD
jgi:hypothetical protein